MILLAILPADFSELEDEFSSLNEDSVESSNKSKEGFWNLLPNKKDQDLIDLNEPIPVHQGNELSCYVDTLLRSLLQKGDSAVDLGMGIGACIAEKIGKKGRVYVYESNPDSFRRSYWELSNLLATQAYLYFLDHEADGTLVIKPEEKIKLVSISAGGREKQAFESLKDLIKRDRPAILVEIIGGISLEQADEHVKREYKERRKAIEQMGYHFTFNEKDFHLALPL